MHLPIYIHIHIAKGPERSILNCYSIVKWMNVNSDNLKREKIGGHEEP